MNYKLSDVAEFQKGFAFKSKDFINSGVPIVKVTNLNDESIDCSGCVFLSPEKAEEYKRYNLRTDDIVITTVGSWPTNPASVVGKVVKVPVEANGSLLNQNAVRIRANNKIQQKYLYYYLRDQQFRDYIIGTAQGSANQASITQNDLKNYDLEIPSDTEQIATANVLSNLDKKIETNNQINEILENMAQAIFTQWFVEFEFPNEDGEPYKSSGGEMVESELGMIPKGWEVRSLSELVVIDTKSIKPFENKKVLYEHYSIPALDSGSYPIFELGSEVKSNKYRVSRDSILISKLNPTTKRIWLPLCLSDKAICSTEFINFIPINGANKYFIYSIIDSERFSEFLVNHATGSTGSRQRVKPKDTLNYRVVSSDNNIIDDFNIILKSIYERRNNNLKENNSLMNLRDILLPKLMSGEIRVPIENN